MKLIALGHKAGVGKTTASNYLVHKYGFTRLSFAGPLKRGVAEIFGVEIEDLYSDKKKQVDEYWGISMGEVLQYIGTEMFRNGFGKMMVESGRWTPQESCNFWVNRLIREIPNYDRVVIDDLRFPNEFDAIQSLGGITVKLQRKPDHTGRLSQHESETALDNETRWSKIITNDSDNVEDLYRQLDEVIKCH